MSTLSRCALVALMVLCFAILGMSIHEFIPFQMSFPVDMARSISGLVGTLFAIVLGLLVSSSYNAFNGHQADLNSLVTVLANIDLLLKRFQAKDNASRHILREIVIALHCRYWPEKNGTHWKKVGYANLSDDIDGMIEINKIAESMPGVTQDDINAIRQLSSNFVTTQSNIIRNLSNQVPSLLLFIIFGWACLLFFLYGSTGEASLVSAFLLSMGSLAVASTNFLILELTQPYHGIFKVSSAALDLLIDSMNKDQQELSSNKQPATFI
ncbi:bestrophin-like domain [Vogesella indigofera]|uniref:bestrophin-like domain n=1 Tax=Vogesella indigofera TaxID=45465 RepID=UPI00234E3CA7|nr:hypothetical protein [Vogesella indigofera]MDC7696266.1 hypothetical protein [Vogesella indigofera]